jgi:hypothetical protein
VNKDVSYDCKCAPGFEGKLCETNINECASNPCGVHAKHINPCVDLVNDYQCNCETGWTGKNCDENIDECKEK